MPDGLGDALGQQTEPTGILLLGVLRRVRLAELPVSAHWLIEVGVGRLVADEGLLLGVIPQWSARLQGDLGEVHQGAGAVAINLVEGELGAGLHGLNKVGDHGFRILQSLEGLLEVRDVSLHAFEDFALGTGNERGLFVLVFAVQDNLGTVFVFQPDGPEGADRIRILHWGVGLDFHRAFVVLAEDVLHGVEVMLAHVSQSTSIVVPITAEGPVHAVRVVRLVRGRPEPEVVIEFRWDGLGCQVGAADPIKLPIEAG